MWGRSIIPLLSFFIFLSWPITLFYRDYSYGTVQDMECYWQALTLRESFYLHDDSFYVIPPWNGDGIIDTNRFALDMQLGPYDGIHCPKGGRYYIDPKNLKSNEIFCTVHGLIKKENMDTESAKRTYQASSYLWKAHCTLIILCFSYLLFMYSQNLILPTKR